MERISSKVTIFISDISQIHKGLEWGQYFVWVSSKRIPGTVTIFNPFD